MALRTLTVCILLLLAPVSALAWDYTGHRLTAFIAFERMQPETREAILLDLVLHPRFQPDFQGQLPEQFGDLNSAEKMAWFLSQAAVWPDIIRELEEEEKQKYHHGRWHYITNALVPEESMQNYIDAERLKPPTLNARKLEDVGNIMQALNLFSNSYNDKEPPIARSLAICWIFHLVGDLHQPLHTTSIFTPEKFPKGDKGGNAISVGEDTLHWAWDSGHGRPADVKKLMDAARRFVKFGHYKALGEKSLENTEFTAWMEESQQFARTAVHGFPADEAGKSILELVVEQEFESGTGLSLELSKSYRDNIKKLSVNRMIEAGYRLAALMDRLYSKSE